jgi:hypothetical protein
MAADWTNNHNGAGRTIPDQIADFIIYTSFLKSETEWWIHAFQDSQKKAAHFYRDLNTYWRTIAIGVTTPEIEKACLQCLPNLDTEKYFQHHAITPAPQKITPLPTPRPKTPRAPRPQETIQHFITDHAPSIAYLQTFVFISRHTRNRFSARGREVYPYGQEYVARNININPRTVRRIFSWLKRHHIIFKRSNENPELHKSATWFVCTSWKQSTYFLDPEGRRPKKRSLRSPRKRHFTRVHT